MDQAITDCAFLLSRLFSYPDHALVDTICSGEASTQVMHALEALPGWSEVPECDRAELEACARELERSLSGSSVEESYHRVRAEYTNLLYGMPRPRVQPYESVFRGERDGRRVLLMVDEVAMQVRSAYKCAGVVVANPSEPCDCVSTELEFLGLLASRDDGAAYEEFFGEHCASWMPDFAREVMNAAEGGSYLRLAAACLLAFVGARRYADACGLAS